MRRIYSSFRLLLMIFLSSIVKDSWQLLSSGRCLFYTPFSGPFPTTKCETIPQTRTQKSHKIYLKYAGYRQQNLGGKDVRIQAEIIRRCGRRIGEQGQNKQQTVEEYMPSIFTAKSGPTINIGKHSGKQNSENKKFGYIYISNYMYYDIIVYIQCK